MGVRPLSASATLTADYFDALYAKDPDPWRFQTSDYEDAKYTATIAALRGRTFATGLEVGCSIGVLTGRLATIAESLVATDISARALEAARARNQAHPHVSFSNQGLPKSLPDGPFDLIVLSEVLYYLDRDDLLAATDHVIDRMAVGGDVLLVHWLGETAYPLTGDAAAEGFLMRAGRRLTTVQQARTEHYRLDHLRRPA
jgi:predicted TPR repeat methyltransferase